MTPGGRRGGVFTLGALIAACSARSIPIGGDPRADAELAGVAGAVPTGGTANGGSGALGPYGLGGNGASSGSTGGTFVIGGATSTAGSPGGGGTNAEGGDGDGFDPYPPVAWEGGQGYRDACHEYPEGWGFTCWNVTDGQTRACRLDGDPYCNACSCAVPCGPSCPSALSGESPICINSESTQPSCFVSCDEQACPTGMTCALYPGAHRRVCVWVTDPPRAPR